MLGRSVTRSAREQTGLEDWELNLLGRYNADVGRGVVFTAAAQARMAELQRRFNRHVVSRG